MSNNKKNAFTLAEVMVVLVLIGVLSAILIPTLFTTTPDQDKLKAKKAFNTLTRAVENLTNSSPYDTNGGSLDSRPFATTENARRTFFCNQLASILNVTEANCSLGSVDNADPVARAITESGCAEGTTFASGATSNAMCVGTTGEGENAVPFYTDLAARLDTTCANDNLNNVAINFETLDGIEWAIQLSDFSHTATITTNGITSPAFYNVVCVNLTDDWTNKKMRYSFGIRKDGKIVAGRKMQRLLDDKARDILNGEE